MRIKQDAFRTFNKAYASRQKTPPGLPGNPYKLEKARHALSAMLECAEAAIEYENAPKGRDPHELLGDGCLANERNRWANSVFRERLPRLLGYDAVPGLEQMGRPDLLGSYVTTLRVFILPAAAAGLSLPKGMQRLSHLLELLECTLALTEDMLDACGETDA